VAGDCCSGWTRRCIKNGVGVRGRRRCGGAQKVTEITDCRKKNKILKRKKN